MMRNMKLGTRLIMVFLLVGLIPFIVMGIIALSKSSTAISDLSNDQLVSLREIKKLQIETFLKEQQVNLNIVLETVSTLRQEAFDRLKASEYLKKGQIETLFKRYLQDIETLSSSQDVTALIQTLSVYQNNTTADSETGENTDALLQKTVIEKSQVFFQNYIRRYGYYDCYLIHGDEGLVSFTAQRKEDLGKKLKNGPFQNEGLAKLWRKVLDTNASAFLDFEPYTPNKGTATAFVGAPIKDNTGTTVGVCALQLPYEEINAVVQPNVGLGKSGETYLVGLHNTITAFRSTMLTMGNGRYVFGYEIHTEYIDKIIQTMKPFEQVFTDSKGALVMIEAAPLDIKGLHWGIITKMDFEEAIAPKLLHKKTDFYADYVERHGYHDLFLIHPKGRVFYSVGHKADYDTNMINGKYANSGLGKLVRHVLQNKKFALADVELYEPDNNEPSSFIAEPLLINNEVELIVALELPMEAINEIMQQRQGMGKTGETYLVGGDRLMRSDSILDPEKHSVKSSLSNPVTGKLDIEPVKKGLNGQTGEMVYFDEHDHLYKLAGYAPIKVGNETWVLIAEKEKSEAFESVTSLIWMIVIIGIIGTVLILLIALFFAKSITRPIVRAVNVAKAVSEGDISQRLNIKTTDEIGTLAQAIDTVPETIDQVIKEFKSLIDKIERGRFNERGDQERFHGAFSDVIVGGNNIVDTFVKFINAIPVPLAMVIDKEFSIQFMSKNGAALLGMDAKDIVDKKCHDLVHAGDCQTKNCACFQTMSNGRQCTRETDVHPGGMDLEIEYTAEPVKDQKGQILGAIEVVLDKTEVNKLMRATQKSAELSEKIAKYNQIEIERLANNLRLVSIGDLDIDSDISSSDEDTQSEYDKYVHIYQNLNALTAATQNIVDVSARIASGDLSVTIEMRSNKDTLMLALKDMVGNLHSVIEKIKNHSGTLSSSAEQLSTISSMLASGSEEMTAQSETVASATEEMSANINAMASASEEMSVNAQTVSSTAEQMSHNMSAVASAVEEMTMSMNEIGKQASDGASVSAKAITIADQGTTAMNTLGVAAKAIGEVTEVIKQIAEQTNLLALNATIEAASAGDAGRGFAVVANEIKELANQSAKAAEDIAKRIEGVQGNTQEAIKVIGEVSEIIHRINESVSIITASVDEQTKAANEIASNIGMANSGANNIATNINEVASGATDSSKNAGEAAQGAIEVSKNIQGVSIASKEANKNAQQVNDSAVGLAQVANELQDLVGQFKL
ncbi:MAG: HAMP domain-containing protein [Candidatus Magnetomorum sp.]|nr:HAMP domain-containing protein [Candidatus Magnetomorum sp.]